MSIGRKILVGTVLVGFVVTLILLVVPPTVTYRISVGMTHETVTLNCRSVGWPGRLDMDEHFQPYGASDLVEKIVDHRYPPAPMTSTDGDDRERLRAESYAGIASDCDTVERRRTLQVQLVAILTAALLVIAAVRR